MDCKDYYRQLLVTYLKKMGFVSYSNLFYYYDDEYPSLQLFLTPRVNKLDLVYKSGIPLFSYKMPDFFDDAKTIFKISLPKLLEYPLAKHDMFISDEELARERFNSVKYINKLNGRLL